MRDKKKIFFDCEIIAAEKSKNRMKKYCASLSDRKKV